MVIHDRWIYLAFDTSLRMTAVFVVHSYFRGELDDRDVDEFLVFFRLHFEELRR